MTSEPTPFLQTPAWGRFQRRLGRSTRTGGGDGWRWLTATETGRLSTRNYAPYGPVADTAAHLDHALASLERAGKDDGVDFVRVEPTGLDAGRATAVLTSRGYRKTNHVQPEDSWLLPLTGGRDDVLAGMRKNNRNLYRTHAAKGLRITMSTDPADIGVLVRILGGLAQRARITEHSEAYYAAQADTLLPSGDARLFFVRYRGEAIAAALVYDSATARYYAHAADDGQHRLLQPATALVAEMIVDAADRGLATFDFAGIAPEGSGPDHPWAGFSRFKKSFGGYPVRYAGTWEKPVRRWKYAIYLAARRIAD